MIDSKQAIIASLNLRAEKYGQIHFTYHPNNIVYTSF
jgi:hypothetical protein